MRWFKVGIIIPIYLIRATDVVKGGKREKSYLESAMPINEVIVEVGRILPALSMLKIYFPVGQIGR
jgi:hypothetical protein